MTLTLAVCDVLLFDCCPEAFLFSFGDPCADDVLDEGWTNWIGVETWGDTACLGI